MFQIANVKFSSMKNKPIVDSNGDKIGRIIDFHFTHTDGKMMFSSIVMGGSRIEEFLESIGAKNDIDPFFSIDVIDKYENDTLYLKVPYQKLTKPVKLGDNEFRLSNLGNCEIIDVDSNKIGKIKDVIFDDKHRPWFIVHGRFFEESFEKLGIKADIDPLIPPEFIKQLTKDVMTLKYSKIQLKTTAEQEWEEFKRQLAVKGTP
ncbi:MAG: PRC-barrel domain-containing protein, partial [Candidatus Hermodarchaeota archaeon]|nr:PRC-barrel domain-containing protein [Candidatus Hermodarchaeota archaeon]